MSKKVRLEDSAREANVSIATVLRALAENPAVNDKTKRRIWNLARRQGYNIRSVPGSGATVVSTLSIIVPKPQRSNGARISGVKGLERAIGLGIGRLTQPALIAKGKRHRVALIKASTRMQQAPNCSHIHRRPIGKTPSLSWRTTS